MKYTLPVMVLIFGFAQFVSCESNALKQDLAEKSIREFVSTYPLLIPQERISLATIQKIEKTDVFTEHRTRIKVIFKPEHSETFTLRFIFSRTPKDQWFLESIVSDDPQPDIRGWLTDKKQMHIAVQ